MVLSMIRGWYRGRTPKGCARTQRSSRRSPRRRSSRHLSLEPLESKLLLSADGLIESDTHLAERGTSEESLVQTTGASRTTAHLDGLANMDRTGIGPLAVASHRVTPSGFTARFTGSLDTQNLNLYDTQTNDQGPADVALVRHLPDGSCEDIPGSLVVDSDSATFIVTGGPLPAGDYTATLRGSSNGFKDLAGQILDGDGDGSPGGDYRF